MQLYIEESWLLKNSTWFILYSPNCRADLSVFKLTFSYPFKVLSFLFSIFLLKNGIFLINPWNTILCNYIRRTSKLCFLFVPSIHFERRRILGISLLLLKYGHLKNNSFSFFSYLGLRHWKFDLMYSKNSSCPIRQGWLNLTWMFKRTNNASLHVFWKWLHCQGCFCSEQVFYNCITEKEKKPGNVYNDWWINGPVRGDYTSQLFISSYEGDVTLIWNKLTFPEMAEASQIPNISLPNNRPLAPASIFLFACSFNEAWKSWTLNPDQWNQLRARISL